MPAPYSNDLRLRVMDAVRNGMAYEEVSLRFRVSNSSILRWVRRLRESGSYAAFPWAARNHSCWPTNGSGCCSASPPSRT